MYEFLRWKGIHVSSLLKSVPQVLALSGARAWAILPGHLTRGAPSPSIPLLFLSLPETLLNKIDPGFPHFVTLPKPLQSPRGPTPPPGNLFCCRPCWGHRTWPQGTSPAWGLHELGSCAEPVAWPGPIPSESCVHVMPGSRRNAPTEKAGAT